MRKGRAADDHGHADHIDHAHVPTPEEKKRFQEAASGIRKWYTDKYGSDWLDKLDAAVEECKGKVDEEFFAAEE